MNPEIGLQLYSVKNSLKSDYLGTLRKIAEIGYQNLELITTITPGGLVFGQDMQPAELRQHLDQLGLRAVGCHFIPTPDLPLEKVLADLGTVGAGSLVCAAALFKDEQSVNEFIETFNQIGEVCRRHGVQLYYHNHFQEFQVFGDRAVYEMMLAGLDADMVRYEFDTYWALRAGQDPIFWLKKLGARCDLIHQKDLPAEISPVNVFERLGYDGPITFESFAKMGDILGFAEIGEGTMNIAGIIQAARAYNQARYIIVEQDTTKRDELESIAISYANLSRLLG